MPRILSGVVLLLATCVLAQQPPPGGTPPTFPQGQPAPGRMPPAQNAPPRGLSNQEAAQQIQQGWKAEPSLRDSSIAVQVNEAKVVLSGTLQNEQQRDRALRIARSYAGEREVVDKLKMQQGM